MLPTYSRHGTKPKILVFEHFHQFICGVVYANFFNGCTNLDVLFGDV